MTLTPSYTERYVPYNVSVRAANAGGLGKPVYEVVFTEEGGGLLLIIMECLCMIGCILTLFPVPSVAPQNVAIERFNSVLMNITWEKISLTVARGFLTGYLIRYDVVNGRRKREATSVMVGPDETYRVIGGLTAKHQYTVTVSGVTVAGEGEQSTEITLESERK